MKKPHQTPPNQQDRKDRLSAALKANIAKRKAQAKARATGPDDGQDKKKE
jgi:hypothetical protein